VQETGRAAHDAVGCRGFSRVDLRLSPEGEIFVLEVNTIPGLTERSLLPMAAKSAGLTFSELCVKMLCGALTNPNSGMK
ncbi:MAG: D-alanine--D-alanine ligase, partial [Candidatus Omnitrophota bacterium]